MTDWPIALSTGCFYNRSIFEVLDAVRHAEFRQLEICSFPKHLDYHKKDEVLNAAERLRELELDPVSFHAPFSDRIDITALDEAAREAAVQELLLACESAALMGCEHVVLHPGPEREHHPPEEEFLEHMHHAAASLNRVAARCCELEVHLLLENMLSHLMFGHVRDMMYLLGEIRTCEVGACLDTGHAHLAREMDVVIQKLSGHLRMVHVNDNRGDWDAHLPPGEGVIDWSWVIGELRRHAFDGVLVLELSGGEDESAEEILARAVSGRAFLHRVIRESPG
ncbi:MAG TPA: sugar phosphate isomerase/epimerase family protein [Verrucomicrobiales bacterium]|nr:sugar phosphate isomerase/epimerase family protein [Verrucomicrobiales bacterium]